MSKKIKNKIIYSLSLLWSSFFAYTFPFCFGCIFLDITGHSKGYSYNLGSEKSISIAIGCIELVFWIALALPSYVYVFRKDVKSRRLYILICAILYLLLAAIFIISVGGWAVYVKGVFNT